MTRVAAIDCGTNTIRLLITDLDAVAGTEAEVLREMRVVRLGQDVDRTGCFADEALERVFTAVEEYADLVRTHGAEAVRFCATSAARDVRNGQAFLEGVQQRIGVAPEVIAGETEAQLSFDGATRSLSEGGPFLVIDIGGGSTELILGDGHGTVRAARSLDIGAVRLTERHLHTDPPIRPELEAAGADIEAALDGCDVPMDGAATVVGVAGTITTMAAGVLALPGYDRAAIHHARLALHGIEELTHELITMSTAERKTLPYMHPGRADVIPAGALILDAVLRRCPVSSLLVSEADILDGIAWSLV